MSRVLLDDLIQRVQRREFWGWRLQARWKETEVHHGSMRDSREGSCAGSGGSLRDGIEVGVGHSQCHGRDGS